MINRYTILCGGIFLLLGCSDPVSSNDLDAGRVDVEITIEPAFSNIYDVSATLRPDGDEHDYVLLNGNDSFYVQVGRQRNKLVLEDTEYIGQFEAFDEDSIFVVAHFHKAGNNLSSSVLLPPRIVQPEPMRISAKNIAEVFWTQADEAEMRIQWKAKCSGSNLSRQTSYSEILPDSLETSLWDMRDFVNDYDWGKDFGCHVEVELERVRRGITDFGFRSGWIIAIQREIAEFNF